MARLTQSCVKYRLLQHLGGIQQEAKQNHLVTYDSLLEQQKRKKETDLAIVDNLLEDPSKTLTLFKTWSTAILAHPKILIRPSSRAHLENLVTHAMLSPSQSSRNQNQSLQHLDQRTAGRSEWDWGTFLGGATSEHLSAHRGPCAHPHLASQKHQALSKNFELCIAAFINSSQKHLCSSLSFQKWRNTFSTHTKPSQASCQLARPMMKVSTLHSFVLAYLTTLGGARYDSLLHEVLSFKRSDEVWRHNQDASIIGLWSAEFDVSGWWFLSLDLFSSV